MLRKELSMDKELPMDNILFNVNRVTCAISVAACVIIFRNIWIKIFDLQDVQVHEVQGSRSHHWHDLQFSESNKIAYLVNPLDAKLISAKLL